MSCDICGHVFTQKHRLKPGAWGGSYDDADNVALLCPNHHAAVHFLMKWYTRELANTPGADDRWEAYRADLDLWRFFQIEVKPIVIERLISQGKRRGSSYRTHRAFYTKPL